jgi:predicted phosphohydrolase
MKIESSVLNGVKFQIISDVHLEHQTKPVIFYEKFPNEIIPISANYILKTGDILCLLGDIGHPIGETSDKYWEFLTQASVLYKKVLLLTGNHEYYNSSIEKVDLFINSELKRRNLNNVIFLKNKKITIGGLVILGSTLWSNIPPDKFDRIKSVIGDYKYIHGLTYEKIKKIHSTSVEWLTKEIKANKYRDIMVLTHHAPLMSNTSDVKFHNDPVRFAYSSNLSKLVSSVKIWAYGHTHHNHFGNNWIFSGGTSKTIMICNQMGYPKKPCMFFSPSFYMLYV